MKKLPHVIIIGAGFGGLQAAQSLATTEVEVTLIDRHNYHTFTPLLYQVATAQLSPEQVTVPVRTLLRQANNVHFLQAEVQQIDFVAREIKTHNHILNYDFLVLATGTQCQFWGIPGAKSDAFPLKTLSHAINLRHHLLSCFEQAATETNWQKRKQLLTISLVGGGATGVELAGALTELVTNVLPRDYPNINPYEITIILIQSGDRLLAELTKSLGDYTVKRLRRLGVKVMLQSKASQVTADGIELDDGTWIPSSTVIWAVGVKAAIPKSFPFIPKGKQGKIIVLPTLQIAEYPEVFAIGDLAKVNCQGKSLSGVAPEALQQGVYVARAIRKQLQGKTITPFNYFNKGRLAIIGCYSGVGQIGIFKLTGFLPWFFWLAVHLIYFPDWRNRLMILLTWFYNYFTGDRPVRLILVVPKFVTSID
ncbi:MAG: NAD(P)/FAD-dependent oxidoreductase [Xenococcaceae cyanobacterium MO_188.B32]|nr:NAD(P)/FAD-dependent oxidoreductase [Xenococcaceae cyanobacterium MO_188.B32]